MTRRLSALLLLALALSCATFRTRHHGPAPPSFTVTAPAAKARLLPGLSTAVTLVLQAEPGFTGRVALSVADLGTDLSAHFEPAAVDLEPGVAVQAVLTLAAAENVATGSRSLTVLATGAQQSATAALDLDIPRATFFTLMTYQGSTPANFAFLVYRDGDGPWTPVPGNGGTYRLPVTDAAGRFGVVYGDPCVTRGGTQWLMNGFFETLADSQLLQAIFLCNPQGGPPPDQFGLSGSLLGVGQATTLVSGNSGIWSFPPGTRDYGLNLYKGSSDLLAGRYPSSADYVPSRFIVDRGRAVQAPLARDFDFATQGEDAGARLAIQRPALEAGETFLGSVRYQTANGQSALLGQGQDLAAYAPFPPALAAAGDQYSYGFQANGSGTQRVVGGSSADSPGPLAPRLPSRIPPLNLDAGSGKVPLLTVGWEAMDPAPLLHQVVLYQRQGEDIVYWYLYLTKGWLGGGPHFTWTQPDPGLIPGFGPGATFRRGVPLTVSLSQSGSQAASPAVEALLGRFPQGGLRDFASRLPLRPDQAAPAFPFPFRFVLGPPARGAALAPAAPVTEFLASSRSQGFTP